MWWSWSLALVGLIGIYLSGKKRKSGWAWGIAVQALWITYAIVTEQYGFILGALGYTVAYARNYWLWRSEEIAGRTSGN